ncbi:MAG: hypothetical protein IKL82_00130 [Clostridia bacterium]|nr:hypothetical protein [Clostridia bacterium]
MSIGKNAIKRVENNGYSNVKTTAPDMVNSTVIGATSPEVIKMVENAVSVPEKEVAPTPKTKKAPAKKPSKKALKSNFFSIGDDIPVYYL